MLTGSGGDAMLLPSLCLLPLRVPGRFSFRPFMLSLHRLAILYVPDSWTAHAMPSCILALAVFHRTLSPMTCR